MAIYGFDRYGSPTTYGGATFTGSGFDLSPIYITEVGYNTLSLQWTTPDDTVIYSRIRIVRSQTGYPVDETDGATVREILPAAPSSTHTDMGLSQGSHYYYRFFVETDIPTYTSTLTYNKGQIAKSLGGVTYVSIVDGNVGNLQTNTAYWAPVNSTKMWVLAGQAVALTTKRFDHTTRLYEYLSPHYRGVAPDWVEPPESDKTTLAMSSYPPLAKFLAIFGWGLDGIQTKYENNGLVQSPGSTPAWYLEPLSHHLGLPLEASASSRLQRIRLSNAALLSRSRGTVTGLQDEVTASLGYDAVVSVGVNKVLTWDQSLAQFPEHDYWDPAASYAVGEFVRFGGSGTVYKALLANRGAAQGPPNGGSNTWWTPAANDLLPTSTQFIRRYGSKAGWIPDNRTTGQVDVVTGATHPVDATIGNAFQAQNISGSTATVKVQVADRFYAPTWTGAAVTHYKGDLVTYNSQIYEAITNSYIAQPDISPSRWRVFHDRVGVTPDPKAVYENAIPVTPSVLWTFSVYVMTATGLAGASAIAEVSWYTAAGTFISTSTSASSAITGAWTRRTVSATAPATARYAIMSISGTSVTATGKFLFKAAQMEQAAAASTYVPPRQVSVLAKPTRVNHLLNPSFEATGSATTYRINLFPNPIAANDAVSWTVQQGTGGVAAGARQTGQTGWAYAITTAYRATWSTATSAVTGGVDLSMITGLTATRTYGALLQVRCSKIQRVRFQIDWYTSGSVYISSTVSAETVLTANTVTTFSVTGPAPATADRATVRILAVVGTSGTNWAIGDWLEATIGHFEETDLVLSTSGSPDEDAQPFVGSFPATTFGPDYTFGFSGTAHASSSVMSFPSVPQYGGTQARIGSSSEFGASGSRSLKIRPLGTNNDSFAEILNTAQATTAGLLGKTITASALGHMVKVHGGSLHNLARRVMVYVTAPSVAGGVMQAYLGNQGNNAINDFWTALTFVIPPDATFVSVRLYNGSLQPGDVIYWDSAMVEVAPQRLVYFDGSYGLSTEYFWAGAAHASKSYYYQGFRQKRYRLNDIIKRAIPHGVPFTTRYTDV